MVLPRDQIGIIRRSSQRMLIGRLETLEELKGLPDLVAEEVTGLSEDQLRWRPGPEEWSIKEVCAYLRDHAEVSDLRVHMILTQTAPKLPPLGSGWVRERNYQDQNIAEVLKAYRAARDRTIERIQDLPDANWARSGYHPTEGLKSIRQLVERMLADERGYLHQIEALKMQTLQ